jgi:hypothetical protein
MLNKSINKKPCENYLFEDYRLKGWMVEQKCKINVSGRSQHLPLHCP